MTIDPKAVEAVAKAIADAHWPEDRGQMSDRDWECWLEEAQAAITAYHAYLAEQGLVIQQGWRPIEEALEDGSIILGFFPSMWMEGGDYAKPKRRWGIATIRWDGYDGDYSWHTLDGDSLGPPTHFMPLPLPPAEQGDAL